MAVHASYKRYGSLVGFCSLVKSARSPVVAYILRYERGINQSITSNTGSGSRHRDHLKNMYYMTNTE